MVDKSRGIRLTFVTLVAFQVAGCFNSGGKTHSKGEAILKQDLYSMRLAIDQYTQDKNRAPESLDDLVRARYLPIIPTDPFTGSTATWKLIEEDDRLQPIDKKHRGITDVRSGSNAISSEGTPYSSW
jgi:general secretion pathway protein G